MAVNPDLQKERDSSNINVEELACVIHGGAENLAKRREVQNIIYNDPDYKAIPNEFLSRDEVYSEAVRKGSLALSKRDGLSALDSGKYHKLYNGLFGEFSYNTVSSLQESMFMPVIQSQMSDEQKRKWLPLSQNYHIIGTYAQTELGHGTFVRGLETTAHYDPSTQEFILNSPTTTSIKWWPGGLGKTSNFAVVAAQLYTLGKCHGVHFFLVQLRSLEDHSSLPGITVGDIGPKFGNNENDNGYLKLDNYRIPREHMLMKYSKVAPDGTYSKPPREKLSYGTMTRVRVNIVGNCAHFLSKGVTIAVRYSAVRRQSEMRPGEPEPQILSYLTQQHKLFPLLATAYAFHFTNLALLETFHTVSEETRLGKFASIQELHAISSGLKAYTSWVMSDGLETLRMSCGGHGYSQASGFPRLYADAVPSCTYEGENTVLMLQTARYLVKCVRSGKSDGNTVSYLFSKDKSSPRRNLTSTDFLVSLYEKRAYNFVHFAAGKVDALMRNGVDLVEALNSSSVFLVQAAMAHCHYFVVRTFAKQLRSLSVSYNLVKVLSTVARLYMLDGINKNSGEFLEGDILSGAEVKAIRQMIVELLPVVRIDAVALVDAFDFKDAQLHSVLGRYDGNVYENLFKWAQNSPLNKTDVHPTYHKYLGPLLKRNASKL